jgi:hypothetical protein
MPWLARCKNNKLYPERGYSFDLQRVKVGLAEK